MTDLTVFNSVGFVAGWNFLYFSGSFYDDVVYSLGSGKLTIDVEATIEVQSSEPTGLNWIYEEE